jgi:hypothetical protein
MTDYKEKLLVLSLLLLALGMRIHSMTRGLFYDELYTVIHCIQAPTLADALYKNFSTANHLGYTAIAYPLCHLWGTNEWVLRLPALLFGLGSIYIFYHWARKYFGQATAILGSLFLALAPAHIIWSTSGRGYSACVFFTILSTALYFSLLEKPSLKNAIMLAVTNALGFSFQILFLFVFLAQFLHFMLICLRFYTKPILSIKKGSLSTILLAMGSGILLSILIYFPNLITLREMSSGHSSLAMDFPLTLLRDLLSLPLWPLGLLCLILMFIGLIPTNDRLPHWRVYVVLLFLTIFPLWLMKPVYLYPRFFSFLLPFLFLLIANGITGIVKNSPIRARPFVLIMITALMGFILWSWSSKPSKIVEDFHYKFRESMAFAEKISSSQTRFCAFGPEDGFYQFYSHRPVTTFQTFGDFKSFYDSQKEILCFVIMGPPMPDEHKKMFLYLLSLPNIKEKNFDNVMIFDLKG